MPIMEISTNTQTAEDIKKESKKIHPLYSILKENPELFLTINDGDSSSATLLKKTDSEAYFDIEGKTTGIVYGTEFTNAKDIIKKLKEGESCSVTIVLPENENGYAEVSLVKALKQKNWDEIKKTKDDDTIVSVKITGANSGGLLAEMNGIKAFIPVSQLSAENYPHVDDGDKKKILDALQKFVGKEMEAKVLDFNSKNNKLILSEKEVSGESVRKILEKFKEGDVVDVIVSGIADFGVFVRFTDEPKIEGLVHISEIDHKLIDSPKEVVKVGDSLKAKIVEIKNGRASLSFKALKENPWDKAGDFFKEGQEVSGRVTKFNPFGALIFLGHDLQGLIHISEFSAVANEAGSRASGGDNQERMKETLSEDKEYDFVIAQFKPEEKRIILKLKKQTTDN